MATAREVHARAHLVLDGRLIAYEIKRSARRRSIAFTIDEQGLRVGAPWHASQRSIESALRKHWGWVLAKLAEWHERRVPPRRWEQGERLMLLGNPLTLNLQRGEQLVALEADRLVAALPDPCDKAAIETAVVGWYRERALGCFHDRVALYCRALETEAPSVRLSHAKTRWGSCSTGGRVLLNWRLIQMPLALVDYVVAHELAHLVEMNHSPRFWSTVARMVPDYRARRAAIRSEGGRYLLI